MYEFFPEKFVPDAAFYEKLKAFRRYYHPLLLWIENPQDEFRRWHWISANIPGCLAVGPYKLYFSKLRTGTGKEWTADGAFMCGKVVFDTSEIVLSPETGILKFSIACPQDTDLFQALGARIQYVIPAAADSIGQIADKKSAQVISNQLLSYKGNARFEVTLSPSELWDVEKTRIALPPENFQSNMTDRLGRPYMLSPEADACLVFARTAHSVSRSRITKKLRTGGHQVYLCYQGGFRAAADARILLGLYGMEYMGSCSRVEFHAGYPAFLRDDPDTEPYATTSWVSFTGDYFSMPESMPLYTASNGALRPYECPVAAFAQQTDAVPYFPWRHAVLPETLEVQAADSLFYRRRFKILVSGADVEKAQTAQTAETAAVTANGLCIGIQGASWNWIGIAQTSEEAWPDVRIRRITPAARKKLLQKDCFIVISSKEEWEAFASGSIGFTVDGWRMTLDPQQWGQAIVVFKYSHTESIQEKLSDHAAFQSLLARAYRKSEIKEPFYNFIQTISDKEFEGVVLLKVKAKPDPQMLSKEVSAVIAMTGEESLDCVYAAVKRSRVIVRDSQIQVLPSDIDALISYEAQGMMSAGSDSAFVCRTVGVTAVLQNSRVSDFSSRTELLPKRMLGETFFSPDSLVLTGRQEMQHGVSVYRFTLEQPVCYAVLQKPVETVRIDRVSMSADDKESRFVLCGNIALAKEESGDIFSYDALAFDGVQIIVKGNACEEFLADLKLGARTSETRKDSFAQAFGAFPKQYIVNSPAVSPDELGFFSITAPIAQGEMCAGWNGIVFEAALGNAGKLGSNATLSFDFIAAWKDGGFYFGVRLQGVFSREFSVQNLIGVGFSSVSLMRTAEQKLLFKLNSVTLKILGLSVPPKSADLYIFGEEGKVGWYFGYAGNDAKGVEA